MIEPSSSPAITTEIMAEQDALNTRVAELKNQLENSQNLNYFPKSWQIFILWEKLHLPSLLGRFPGAREPPEAGDGACTEPFQGECSEQSVSQSAGKASTALAISGEKFEGSKRNIAGAQRMQHEFFEHDGDGLHPTPHRRGAPRRKVWLQRKTPGSEGSKATSRDHLRNESTGQSCEVQRIHHVFSFEPCSEKCKFLCFPGCGEKETAAGTIVRKSRGKKPTGRPTFLTLE